MCSARPTPDQVGVYTANRDGRGHKMLTCLPALLAWCVVEDVRCNLYWEKDHLLLIGWFDSVMLLEIKTLSGGRKIGSVMEWKVCVGEGSSGHSC